MDLRQSIAGILTISMFIMLGNMVKREHVDPFLGNDLVEIELQLKSAKFSNHRRVKLSTLSKSPWMQQDQQPMVPCWPKLLHDDNVETRGSVSFTLSSEPEYHAFQVSIAIMIARKLGAALVLPDISFNKTNNKRLFGDIYDIKHFITSLEGIVQVVKDPPKEQPKEKIIALRTSAMISEEMIETKIEPLFNKGGKHLRFAFHSTSSSIKGKEKEKEKEKEIDYMNSYACLAMFRSLKLQAELQGVVDSIVGTLRSWSTGSFGKFVALDFITEEFQNSSSLQMNSIDPTGIANFLKRIGFDRHTTVYLSQAGRRDKSLVSLRKYFPTTFTKEAVFPMELKAKYLNSEDTEFRKLIDLHVCTQSDVFVSGFHGQFQNSVVAMRIGSGKMQILSLAEAEETSSTFGVDFVPTYISKKTHMAYLCFC